MGTTSIITQTIPAIEKASTLGLAGAANSLTYRIAEVETHFHSAQQIYGGTAGNMARAVTTPLSVTGGNGAFGTEVMIHDGSVIEGGSATKKFDMNTLYLATVGSTTNVTLLEFYALALGANVAATTQDAGDTITKAAHGLLDGSRVMLNTIVTSTGLSALIVYFVVGKTDDTFQVSLTTGGAAVTITTNGTCNYKVATPTLLTEAMINKESANSELIPRAIQMPRQTCNTVLSIRGKATSATNAVGFFVGLHTYAA